MAAAALQGIHRAGDAASPVRVSGITSHGGRLLPKALEELPGGAAAGRELNRTSPLWRLEMIGGR